MEETFAVTPSPAPAPAPSSTGGATTDVTVEDAQKIVDSLKGLLNGLVSADSSTNTFTYIEDTTKIPNYENLIIYISSYSDFTSYNKAQANYIPAANKLYNHVANMDPFTIITSDTLPLSIRPPTGLPLKNKQITGPSSDKLNLVDFSLNAFTVSFFVKNGDFVFVENNPIELFRIFVESPNYIRVLIEPNATDATKVNLVTIFGAETDRYTIPIAKLALKAAGNPILMSISYNKLELPSPKLYIYLGETQFTSALITVPPVFVLGNSPIKINNGGKWDASLLGFLYFKNFITLEMHVKIIEYFTRQSSGVATIIDQLKQLSEDQVAKLNDMLVNQSITINTIQKELEQCKIVKVKTAEDEAKKAEEKWMVKKDGFAIVSSDDLKKCTLLNVTNPHAAGTPPATTGSGGTPPAASTSGSGGTPPAASSGGTGISDTGTPAPGPGPSTIDQFTIPPLDILKDIKSINPDLSKVLQNKTGLAGEIANLFTK